MIPLGVLASARVEAASGFVSSFVQGRTETITAATSHTFTNVPIGTASASRVVIVAISIPRGYHNIPTVTIGGVAATIAKGANTSYYWAQSIAYATVPTGTTADVAVTSVEPCPVWRLGVWVEPSGIGVAGSVSAMAHGAVTANVVSAVGGCIVASYSNRNAKVGVWSSPMTERYSRFADAPSSSTSTAVTVAAGDVYEQIVAFAYTRN